MSKPLKVRSFFASDSSIAGAHDYMRFIRDNPHIEVVSVIVVADSYIVLTYR